LNPCQIFSAGFNSGEEDKGKLYTWEEAKRACPKGWRLPTIYEFLALIDEGSIWTRKGYIFGNSDNYVFLPAAGAAGTYSNGRHYTIPNAGYYWSSTQGYEDNTNIYCLGFSRVGVEAYYFNNHSDKVSLRCVTEKEEAQVQVQESTAQEITNTVTTSTYDIILLKDGQEIKAKVTEITLSEIKYKAFENLEGPNRTLTKNDVFLINYANGTREVISTTKSKQKSTTDCVNNVAFGLDMGLGGSLDYETFASSLGIRVVRHFNPYFGIDFFKINWITDVSTIVGYNAWMMRLQIMPVGFRVNTPVFNKCMSGYAAFRLGYGMIFYHQESPDFRGLCLETELGLNLTRTVFAGFAYNYHKDFGFVDFHTLSFRLGFNFGK